MDHHWPWINNWLGLYNLRYFLLFLFYVMIGWALSPIPIIVTMRTIPFGNKYSTLLTFAITLSVVLGFVMIGFNWWNWYLCLLGDSTVEFWQLKAKKLNVSMYNSASKEYQRFQSMRDNIFKTFGSRNFFSIFLPSIRDLPFFGHEWTYEVLELDNETSALKRNLNALRELGD